ncbi:ribokinase [Caballeronia sordidicola]|uniref:ribokinase n=1 Tax=Caballeronia sordidicola TaxID=196367 RepID=UPI0004D02579|nr:ribokinase [Caballeronia sordidicola]
MNANEARVCVIGNAAIDQVFRVDHLPLAGETSLAIDTLHDFGGKGANQAVMAQRAGAQVQLFAALGDDADGDRFLARLVEEGIDARHVKRLPCMTDISIVTVDQRGENTIVTRNDAAARYVPSPGAVLDATRSGDWIAMQGNLGEAITAEILRHAHVGERRALLNPGPVCFDCRPLLNHVDVLVVNRVEAATLTRLENPEDAARSLRASGAGDVIVTLGSEGVLWCSHEHLVLIPAKTANAIDTVGAGDAFCGALLAALAQGIAMTSALQRAQTAAAFAVARKGTQAAFPSRAELFALFHSLT